MKSLHVMKYPTCKFLSHKTARVSGQNGMSRLYNMLEIHHSGQEPSKQKEKEKESTLTMNLNFCINTIRILPHNIIMQENIKHNTKVTQTIFGCHPSALMQRSIHHQKSSSVSPFQAKIQMPLSARAAATSFWNSQQPRS